MHSLAKPEGYMRLFVDEGEPMQVLLRLAMARSKVPGYLTLLLATSIEKTVVASPRSVPHSAVLVDSLSERELEILNLLARGSSNDEIAEQLVIAVSTVKRHVSNILAKLTVPNRTQAVARAR